MEISTVISERWFFPQIQGGQQIWLILILPGPLDLLEVTLAEPHKRSIVVVGEG